MEVLKFGGSSLVSAAAMQRVAEVLVARRGVQRIVVCSAMGGVTNELLALGALAVARDPGLAARLDALAGRHTEALAALGARGAAAEVTERVGELRRLLDGVGILGELSARSSDALVSFGERLAVPLVTALLGEAGLRVRRVDARDWVATDDAFGAAEVDWGRTAEAVRAGVAADPDFEVLITEGFIGRNAAGETTTLGRGGSDYTASLIARAVGAVCMEKSTDVPGMMTADPRLVPEAQIIPEMSYEEAMELCHFGAKVIYHPTIEPLREAGIPLIVRSTFDGDAPGTRIVASPAHPAVVRALSSVNDTVLLTLVGGSLVARPGFSRRAFTALAAASVNVVLITQSSSEHSLTIGISAADRVRAEAALHDEFDADMALGRLAPLQVESDLSIVALVGGGMKAAAGVSGKAFAALGAVGVNIRAIAQGSTERNISIVVATADVARAVRAIHRAFFDNGVRRVHLLCFGTGQVGAALLGQIQAASLPNLDLRVIGLANSRHALLDPRGVSAADLEAAPPRDPADLLEAALALDLPDLVVVDNTASAAVAATVVEAVRRGVAAVCSNKVAAAGPLSDWRTLTAPGARFRNEANVGAGLPVVHTLRQLRATGDRIHRIEAVMSGSLNHIFSRFGPQCSFEAAVREAAELGYTEPDPRLDLGGIDVARKVLILARFAGADLELADIATEPFLPALAFEGDIPSFFASLPACEAPLAARLAEATSQGAVLRVVGSWSSDGTATVALRALPASHPLAALSGTDNKFSFTTDRYPVHPLVIQGAGAGAEVTAAGVFGDILRTANFEA